MNSIQTRTLALVFVLALGLLFLTRREHWERYDGDTMGTSFHLLWSSRDRAGAADRIRMAVDEALAQLDSRMSTYREDSEIRRFARSAPGAWFPVSRETESVVADALALAEISGGAFDPTVAPLVDLWGFGPGGPRGSPPDSLEIEEARGKTGWHRVRTRPEPPALRRNRADTTLDLSAIAKGHGVDRIANLLEEAGARRYFVEIGGEVRVLGAGPHGPGWKVELERPTDPANGTPLSIALSSGAVATSGTYRNLFEVDGLRFHHALDPRTGRPADHHTVQVTVIADDCRTADARATALLVLGHEEGAALARERAWAARFLVATPDPGARSQGVDWTEVTTPAFDRIVAASSSRTDSPGDRSAAGGAAPNEGTSEEATRP